MPVIQVPIPAVDDFAAERSADGAGVGVVPVRRHSVRGVAHHRTSPAGEVMTMPSRSHRSLGPIGRSVVWIFTPHIDGRLKAHGVTFVSATQHFDTSDSTGMLMLNILLSFAQFERELTRERTMSKMAGRAERGLWNGGNVPLGYDYDKQTQILTPNAPEVTIAQSFFQRLIETRSPCTVANEANARGYRSKLRLVRRRDGAEQPPAERDTLATKIRTRWYRVRFGLYQLPEAQLVKHAAPSSGNTPSGSPTRIRTWNLPVNSRPLYR